MIEPQPKSSEEEIFNVAREISSGDRSKYLDQVCAGDTQTRHVVEELLGIYDRDQSFLESPPPDLAGPDSAPTESPGKMIGPYKILEAIGQGGMGNVYMAEQIEPVHRKVALKIIKSGMDSKAVIARFEAERQALALMDHPNIAKFYDAGLTAGHRDPTPTKAGFANEGQPYFVMELIRGRPIVEYCEQHRLDLKSKLQLFSQVCNAVQHAHQKGIIHRDLKPSNVLVARYDDQPVAKVIDFGVAKAIGERLTEKTMFTRFGQLVGTLEYMSPEQAQLNQLDVDTRSDVYSLGAILYELLTGTPPFEKERLSSAALEEVLRMLREDEPDKPSTRLSKLSGFSAQGDSAAERNLPPRDSSVPADLDWIVMKCLEKDRARRYDTTNALVQDIQRYINHEPVAAGPPTAAYRMQKFVRRNKVAVSVATIVAATLLMGLGVSTWQTIRAYKAEHNANKFLLAANDEKQKVINLNSQLRQIIDILQNEKSKADWHLARVEYQVSKFVRVQVSFLESVIPLLELHSPKKLDLLLELKFSLSGLYSQQGEVLAGLELANECWQQSERINGPDDEETLRLLANAVLLARIAGLHDEAIKMGDEHLRRTTRVHGLKSEQAVMSMSHVALLQYLSGNFQESIRLYRRVQQGIHEQLGSARGRHYTRQEALNFFATGGLKYYASDAPNDANPAAVYLSSYILLCNALQMVGEYDSAIDICTQSAPAVEAAIKIVEQLGGDLRWIVAHYAKIYIRHAVLTHNPVMAQKAVKLLERSVPTDRSAIKKREFGAEILAEAYIYLADYKKAEDILAVLMTRDRESDQLDFSRPKIPVLLGYCQWQLGKLNISEQLLTEVNDANGAARSLFHALAAHYLGAVYLAKGQNQNGEQLLLQGCQEMLQMHNEIPLHDRHYIRESVNRVLDYYTGQSDVVNIHKWKAELLELKKLSIGTK